MEGTGQHNVTIFTMQQDHYTSVLQCAILIALITSTET